MVSIPLPGHTRGSHQGPGSGEAGVHREARRPVGWARRPSVGAHLWNGLDVRARRARTSATPKTVDAFAARQGARELPADHRGQHASCAGRLAEGRAVQDVARCARTHPRRDSSGHVRCRGPQRARPARPPLRDPARSGVVGTTDSARRPSLAGRVEALAQARPRKPGNRRPADADDRRPASGPRSARPHRHHVATADSPQRGRRVPDGQGNSRRFGHLGAGRTRNDRHHVWPG